MASQLLLGISLRLSHDESLVMNWRMKQVKSVLVMRSLELIWANYVVWRLINGFFSKDAYMALYSRERYILSGRWESSNGGYSEAWLHKSHESLGLRFYSIGGYKTLGWDGLVVGQKGWIICGEVYEFLFFLLLLSEEEDWP